MRHFEGSRIPEMRKAPPGRGAQAALIFAADQANELQHNTAERDSAQGVPLRGIMTSEPFVIAISNWERRFAVSIEPRTVDRPTQSFRSSDEATAFAELVRRLEGWPIVDRRQ
jgi:hypothetical protein